MSPSSRVLSPGFHARVFEIVRRIPKGKVTTYGRIAAMLGHPGVARHVGYALAACGHEEIPVPWHRVVNASGKVSTGGDEQRTLLLVEGVQFTPSGAIALATHLWTDSTADTTKPKRSSRRPAHK